MNTWVAAVGSDGYVATVTPIEAFVGGRLLQISLDEDGQALAQPRLVVDGDVKGGRYVSDVVNLVVGQGVAPFDRRAWSRELNRGGRGVQAPHQQRAVESLGLLQGLRETVGLCRELRLLSGQQRRDVGVPARQEQQLQHQQRARVADMADRLGQPFGHRPRPRRRHLKDRALRPGVARNRAGGPDQLALPERFERPVDQRPAGHPDLSHVAAGRHRARQREPMRRLFAQ